jgi:hypothetical protein
VAVIGAAAATVLLAAALYLPVLLHSGPALLLANQFVQPLAWPTFANALLPAWLSIYSQWMVGVSGAGQIVFWLGLGAAWLRHREMRTAQPVLVCGVMMMSMIVFQRVVPSARVFLFLLPAAAGVSAAGIVFLITKTVRRIGVAKSGTLGTVAGCSAALVVFGSVGVSGWQSHWVVDSEETGASPDARAVAAFLGPILEPQDVVVVLPPASAPIHYYLRKQGWSDRGLVADVTPPLRGHEYVIATKESEGQLNDLLGGAEPAKSPTPGSLVVNKSPTMTVYRIR